MAAALLLLAISVALRHCASALPGCVTELEGSVYVHSNADLGVRPADRHCAVGAQRRETFRQMQLEIARELAAQGRSR